MSKKIILSVGAFSIVAAPSFSMMSCSLFTKQPDAQEKSDWDIVDDFYNAMKEEYSTQHSAKTVEEFDVSTYYTYQELGVRITPKDGIEIKFKVISKNINSGTLRVDVELSKGDESISKKITIKGYSSVNLDDQQKVDDIVNAILTTYNTTKTSSIASSNFNLNENVTKEMLGINLSGLPSLTNVDFAIKVTNIDDSKGVVTVVFSVSIDNYIKTKTSVVQGFKKDIYVNPDEDAVNDAISAIQSSYSTSRTTFMPSQIAIVGQTISMTSLGISIHYGGITGLSTRIVVVSLDDSTGTIGIRISVSKGGFIKSKNSVVTDYHLGSAPEPDYVGEAIDAIENAYTTSKTNYLPSEIGIIGAEVQKETLGINVSIPNADKVTTIFRVIGSNDYNGRLSVRVTISRDTISREKDITINGFKSTSVILNQINAYLATISATLSTSKTTTLPSLIGQVQDKTTENALGITLPVNSEITVDLFINAISNNTGTIGVTLKATKEGQTIEKNITIIGYEADHLGAVTDVINSISDTPNTTLTTTLPSSVGAIGSTVLVSQLGIANPSNIQGTTITYEIVSFDDSTGVIEALVTVTKNSSTSSKTITISNFLTTDKSDALDVATSYTNTTTTNNLVKASSIGKVNTLVTETDLGFTPPTDLKGTTQEYKILSFNDSNGSIVIQVKVMKGTEFATKNITISGFKTINHETVESVLGSILDDQTTSKIDSMASDLFSVGDSVVASVLGILNPTSTLGTTIMYEIISIDDTTGTVVVKAIVSLGAISDSKNVTITGYMTQVDQDVIDVLAMFASSITSTLRTTIPSQIGNINDVVTDADLGITLPSDLKGTTVSFSIINVNDTLGNLGVKVTIEKSGAKTKDKNITISGFWSAADNLKDVNTVLATIVNSTTLHTTSKPSSISTVGAAVTDIQLGISNPTDLLGTTVSYKIVSLDDATGTLVVEVTVSKATSSAKKNITISGFRTSSHDIVESVLSSIQDTLATSKTTVLPSTIGSIGSVVLPSVMGVSSPTNTQGTRITYRIESVNNATGEISATAIVSLNGISVEKPVMIEGYRTQDDQDMVDVLAQFASSYTTTKNTLRPSEIGVTGDVVLPIDLGITIPTNSKGVTVTLSINTTNNTAGTISISVSVTKNSLAPRSKNITVNGFRGATEDQVDTDAVLLLFTNTNTTITTAKPDSLGPVGSIKTAAEIGITEPSNIRGTSITYKVISFDNASGNLIIEVTVTKEGASSKKNITISGFRTNNHDTADAVLNSIKDTLTTTKTSSLASSIGAINDVVTASRLGVTNPAAQGTSISYTIQGIDSISGEITARATVTLQTISVFKTIVISGYRTLADQEVIDVLASFSSSYTTTNKTPRPSEIGTAGSEVTTTELGITMPSDLKGTTVKFTIGSTNDSTGSITLAVTVSKSGAKDSFKNITINGFRSSVDDKNDVDAVLASISSTLTTTKNDIKADSFGSKGQVVTAAEIGITDPSNLNGSTISYKVESFNNSSGTLVIVVTATKEGQSSSKNITISGFRTTNHDTVDAVLVSISEVQTTTRNTMSASSIGTVGATVLISVLGITNPTLQGTTITYKIVSINNLNGELVVNASVAIGSINANKDITINGYRTQVDQDVVDVLASISSSYTTTNSTPRPSEIGSAGTVVTNVELGITLPSDVKGTTIIWTIVSTNNTAGTITISVEVSKSGATSRTKNITINGFRNSTHDQADVDAVVAAVANAQTTSLATVKPDSIGTVGKVVTATELGITPPTNLLGSTITYTIDSFNNSTGILIVTLTATKEGQSSSKSITISGFKTTNHETVESVLASISDSQNTTKTSSLASSIGNVGDNVTIGALGITNPTLQGTTITYTIDSINNITGEISATATVKIGAISASKVITINGYRTQVDQDVVDVLASISSSYTTTNSTPRPSEIGSAGTVVTNVELGITLPSDVKGTTIIWTIVSTNNTAGTITISVEVSKSGATSRTKNITINGFRNSTHDKADVDAVVAAVANAQTTSLDTVKPDSIGTVGKVVTATELGITPPTNLLGSTITYTIDSFNNSTGILIVTLTATKEGQSSSKSITISGFKTTNHETVESVLASISDSQNTTKTSSLASSIGNVGDNVTIGALGITNPTLQGTTITYKIVSVNNLNGELVVNATVAIGSISDNKDITISGFRTQVNQDVADVLASISSSYTTTNSTPRPSEIGSAGTVVTSSNLGITLPSDTKGTTILLTIVSTNNTAGTITISVEVSKSGATSRTKNITINGFRNSTHDQADVDAVIAGVANTLTTSITNSKADSFGSAGADVTSSQIGITDPTNLLGSTITYTIESFNNITGILVVTITATKEGMTASKTITISGYKTNAMETLENVLASIQDVQTTTKTEFLASSVSSIGALTVAGTLGITNPSLDGTTIRYRITAINNVTGEISADAIVQLGQATLEKPITINGYRTQVNQDVADVLASISSSYTTTNSTPRPSEVGAIGAVVTASALGITLPTDLKGATVKLEIQSINDVAGELKITVEVSKSGAITKTKTITINGFRSEAHDQADVDSVLQNIPSTITTSKSHALPTTIGGVNAEVSAAELGITESWATSGITITYKITTINNIDGSLTIEVMVEKATVSSTKTITINGYKTTHHVNVEDVLLNIIDTTTSKTNVNASSIGNVGSDVTNVQLGISNPSSTFGSTIKYTIKSIDDTSGTLVVNVKVTLGVVTDSKDLSITGYQTLPRTNIINAISQLNDSYTTTRVEYNAFEIGNLNSNVLADDLGISLPNYLGVNIELKLSEINHENGSVKVVAIVSSGDEASQGIEITIKGFLTE